MKFLFPRNALNRVVPIGHPIAFGGAAGGPAPPPAAWTPADLYLEGEVGAWYDPSDLSTMYTDRAGSTPVVQPGTVADQTVGLILDKSKGMVLGPELVTNGDFSNGATGWTSTNVTTSVVGGELEIVSTSTANMDCGQTFSVTPGKYYLVTGTFRAGASNTTANSARFDISFGAAPIRTVVSANGVNKQISIYALATGASMTTSLAIASSVAWGGVGDIAYMDNISVKEIAGNHATAPSDAARPLLKIDVDGKYYLKFDGVDDSLSTAAIDFRTTDKMSVWAGTQLGATPADQILAMLTASVTSNPGSWALRSATTNWRFDSKGTIVAQPLVAGAAIGAKAVLFGSGDIAGDRALIDQNLTARNTITTNQGTGTFSNAIMYLAAQGGTAMFFKGDIYSLIVAGKDYPPTEDLKAIEWVAEKTGATLRTPGSPVNTVAPVIAGTPSSGNTLTCSQGTWTGAVSYAYQWYDNGAPIVGAVTATFALTDANKGWAMSCTVTATNGQGSTAEPSNVVEIALFPYSGSWIYTTPPTGSTPAVNTISHADNTVNRLNVSTTNAAGAYVDFGQLRTGDLITINGQVYTVQATPQMYGSYASISIDPTTQQPDATYTVTVTRP